MPHPHIRLMPNHTDLHGQPIVDSAQPEYSAPDFDLDLAAAVAQLPADQRESYCRADLHIRWAVVRTGHLALDVRTRLLDGMPVPPHEPASLDLLEREIGRLVQSARSALDVLEVEQGRLSDGPSDYSPVASLLVRNLAESCPVIWPSFFYSQQKIARLLLLYASGEPWCRLRVQATSVW